MMGNEQSANHLAPEVFVDVLEGVPVDAVCRQHLDRCETCQRELHELEQTLSLLREDAADVPTPTSKMKQERRAVPVWAARVAAAAVVAVSLGYLASLGMEPTRPSAVALEELLPPVDDDDEFQLLLALSGSVDASDGELPEAVSFNSLPVDEFSIDPARLTTEEQQRFVEKLTEAMRSSL